MQKIPVAVVDDDEGVRLTLRTILQISPRFSCAGTYPDAGTALRKLSTNPVPLVVVDLNMPGMDGIECIRRLKSSGEPIRCLVLSAYLDDRTFREAAEAGADGFHAKPFDNAMLLAALELCVAGGMAISPELRHNVARVQGLAKVNGDPGLNEQENRIMAGLAAGRSYEQLAGEMNMSLSLVAKKIHQIYEGYRVHNRTEALRIWTARKDQQ
jgi:DNA-binding NarL/FixJ family response regulator